MIDIQKDLNSIIDAATEMGCSVEKISMYTRMAFVDLISDDFDLGQQNEFITKILEKCEHLKLDSFRAFSAYSLSDKKAVKISIEFSKK